MRLGASERGALLVARPGSQPVRLITGDHAVVWRDASAPIQQRWRAQVVHEVVARRCGRGLVVMWYGSEVAGRTRRAAIDAANMEAQ